jgi:hypothetical protein
MLDRVIVNVGVNYWYERGTARLVQSLYKTGYTGQIMSYTELPEGAVSHEENPYNFKVVAIQKALDAGYKKIFWIDCSIYARWNPNHIFEILDVHGYYFVKNGYNVCQETNDYCLNWFGVLRDEAEGIPQVASGFWGLDFNRPESIEIFNKWKESCEAGCFKGSRGHNPAESSDPRFLWHRQDQSCLSLAIAPYKLNLDEMGRILTYNYKDPSGALFVCNGM